LLGESVVQIVLAIRRDWWTWTYLAPRRAASAASSLVTVDTA
jgi:hypothetical protein